MDAIPALKPSDIEPYLSILEHVQDSGLLDRFDVDIGARLLDVKEHVRQVSATYYEGKMRELQSAPGVNRALPLLLMTDELEKSAKLLDKRFPEPILGYHSLTVCERYSALIICFNLANSISCRWSWKLSYHTSSRTCRTRKSGCLNHP
jgi:hypothetical protein